MRGLTIYVTGSRAPRRSVLPKWNACGDSTMKLSPDLKELLTLFRLHDIEFIIVGAHALAFHGVPRFTGDLDILVRPTEKNARQIVAALEAFGFSGLGISIDDFITPEKVIQLGRPPARVDILTTITGVTWDEAAAGAVEGTLGETSLLFLGRTELITNKGSTGRIKDLADIEALDDKLKY